MSYVTDSLSLTWHPLDKPIVDQTASISGLASAPGGEDRRRPPCTQGLSNNAESWVASKLVICGTFLLLSVLDFLSRVPKSSHFLGTQPF